MIELLLRWIDKYPIVSIEDPLGEDDRRGFVAFHAAAGQRLQIVGDDFLVSHAPLRAQAAALGAANAVLLKPNQRGTLTETLRPGRPPGSSAMPAIVSARSGETEDTTIVAPGDRLAGRPAQGRLVRARRAHGQVERGAAHRRAPRSPRPLRWCPGAGSQRARPGMT